MSNQATIRLDRFSEAAKRVLGGVSVRTKILGMVLGLTLVLGLGVTAQVRASTSRVLLEELDLRGQAIVSDVATRSVDPILLDDVFGLHELLTVTVANHEDVVYAFVVDGSGGVVADSFGIAGFPVGLLDVGGGPEAFRYDSEDGRIHDFAAPVLTSEVGVARIGLSEARLRTLVDRITAQMLLTTLAVAAVGIAGAMFLTWLLTRPILDLVETTQRVRKGDLSVRARSWAKDEVGALADAFNEMLEDLERARATVEAKEAARTRLLEQLMSAQEEERKRIARELHDGVGQALNSIVLGLSTIAQADGSQHVHDEATGLRVVASETIDAVRQLGRELRPSVLDDLGLAEALAHFAAEVRARSPELEVDTHFDLPRRLPPGVEIALYRMVQECMTNAARHSGAHTLSVVVAQRGNDMTQAIVEDDGCGFDVDAVRSRGDSVGIHAVSERAELVGGTVRFESSAGGTTVFIEVPG